ELIAAASFALMVSSDRMSKLASGSTHIASNDSIFSSEMVASAASVTHPSNFTISNSIFFILICLMFWFGSAVIPAQQPADEQRLPPGMSKSGHDTTVERRI